MAIETPALPNRSAPRRPSVTSDAVQAWSASLEINARETFVKIRLALTTPPSASRRKLRARGIDALVLSATMARIASQTYASKGGAATWISATLTFRMILKDAWVSPAKTTHNVSQGTAEGRLAAPRSPALHTSPPSLTSVGK